MTETWKKITEYKTNSRYIEMYVSDLGRFKRIAKSGRINFVNGSRRNDGYLSTLINGKECYCHRIVLKYFIGDCPKNKECDHINRIKNDNRLCNLRWVTKSQNCINRHQKSQETINKQRLSLITTNLVNKILKQSLLEVKEELNN